MWKNWSSYFKCISREKYAECVHNLSPEDQLKFKVHHAAEHGLLRSLKKSLRNVGDVNCSYRYGLTALHLSCQNGHVKCVKAILKLNPDVNARDATQSTPLNAFLETLNFDQPHTEPIMEMLLNAGADPNAFPVYRKAPLHMVAENCEGAMPIRFISLLINHNADVNLQGECGDTPLHTAIYNVNIPAIDLLLKHGADIYIRNESHLSSIELALNGTIRDKRVLLRMGEHLIRIYCCETPVYKRHLDFVCELVEMQAFREQCEREAIAMRCYTYKGFKITYFDILKLTPTKIAKYMQNSTLLDLLMDEDIFSYKTGFIFKEEYYLKISKAYKKHKTYVSVYTFLKEVLPDLPVICINTIIEYLDEKDLIKIERETS